MSLLTFAADNWRVLYLAVGLVVFIYEWLRDGISPGGWVSHGSGPATYSGGFVHTFWSRVFFWLPVLVLLLIQALVKRIGRK
ncbi:hypothetical protein QZM52_12230 [Burkholderia metallica]|uniref:Uncharacterized protein n=1 Tax=Burkholderia metallica TaxID=488729 RepID=A0ABT8PAG2_9BURK|nr:hypothetical protein [Burkholderia metallica]MDN7932048.1 hypothetical protein [Burkholderia metallica]